MNEINNLINNIIKNQLLDFKEINENLWINSLEFANGNYEIGKKIYYEKQWENILNEFGTYENIENSWKIINYDHSQIPLDKIEGMIENELYSFNKNSCCWSIALILSGNDFEKKALDVYKFLRSHQLNKFMKNNDILYSESFKIFKSFKDVDEIRNEYKNSEYVNEYQKRSDFQIQYGKSSSLSESQKHKLKNDIIFLDRNMSFLENILIWKNLIITKNFFIFLVFILILSVIGYANFLKIFTWY